VKPSFVISVIVSLLAFHKGLFAQSIQKSKSVHFNELVVRHNQSSPYPKTIHVIGFLADYPIRGECGYFCWGGTIKVKLTKKIPGYSSAYVYLAINCINETVTKGTLINVVATQLNENETDCSYTQIMNVFDSKGVPFYKLSESETARIK
jgi:hypothetical protein